MPQLQLQLLLGTAVPALLQELHSNDPLCLVTEC